MKTYLLLLIVSQCVLGTACGFDVSLIPPQSTTELSDIEHKYRFVEIWDVKGRSRRDFLSAITSYPTGICQQSLAQMGHPEGFKFPLTSGKLLITTRTAPDYRESAAYQRLKSENHRIDVDKWKSLKGLDFQSPEVQLLTKYIDAFKANDDEALEKLVRQYQEEWNASGAQLDIERVKSAHRQYQAHVRTLSKQDVLAALYFSDDESTLQRASFVLGNFLQTPEDLLDVLPLLLRKEANVQPAIEALMERFRGNIDWESQTDLLPKLLNNPNPFEALLVLKILDKTGFAKQHMEECKKTKLLTVIELLKSDFLTEERNYVLSFLNRYSADALESNAEAWIRRLECA